jgi:lipid A 3-O-deacylase
MSKIKNTLLAGLCAFAFAAPLAAAQAEDSLSFNGGYYDAIRHKYPAAQFGLEYRFSDIALGIHPMVGGFYTTDNGKYGYAGLNWNVPIIRDQLYLIPNFAVGAYGNGNGRDLGGVIEFRSGIEIDYQFQNSQQIGVALNHISNAGIYSRNPGEESVIATYTVPIHTITGLFNR